MKTTGKSKSNGSSSSASTLTTHSSAKRHAKLGARERALYKQELELVRLEDVLVPVPVAVLVAIPAPVSVRLLMMMMNLLILVFKFAYYYLVLCTCLLNRFGESWGAFWYPRTKKRKKKKNPK